MIHHARSGRKGLEISKEKENKQKERTKEEKKEREKGGEKKTNRETRFTVGVRRIQALLISREGRISVGKVQPGIRGQSPDEHTNVRT